MSNDDNQNQNSAVVATTATTPPANTSISIRDNDIIEINAGGKIITTRRSTLTLVPNSLFASMFSGRWTLELDSNGRIFLDEDPEFIESIINFLRYKKREDPSNQVQSTPKVREEKKEDFISLLGYYGLNNFFNPPPIVLPLDVNNIDVFNPNGGSNIIVTRSENQIQFSNSTLMHHFVACKPALNSSGAGSFWKVTVDMSTRSYIFLGIIGNLNASHITSFLDSTFYGWEDNHMFSGKIKNGDSGWTGFTQGECLYFHLISNKLTMFSVQKDQKFIIDNIPTTVDEYYIHFNLYWPGDKLTLEPLNEEECATFLQKLDELDDDDTVL